MDSKTQKWPQMQSPKNFPSGSEGKESSCNAGGAKGRFDPWVRKIPWRRKWEPTPVFLPGESHGQRSLAGYSPWGCRVGHDWRTEPTHEHWQVKDIFKRSCSHSLIFFQDNHFAGTRNGLASLGNRSRWLFQLCKGPNYEVLVNLDLRL